MFELELPKWTKGEATYFITQRPDVPFTLQCTIGGSDANTFSHDLDTNLKEVSFPALSACKDVLEWIDEPKTTKVKLRCCYGLAVRFFVFCTTNENGKEKETN